jgi:hypothetical protein
MPTAGPSFAEPSATPTDSPSVGPTVAPSFAPSFVPSADPTAVPTPAPSFAPSVVPTAVPSFVPSFPASPSNSLTMVPTTSPSQTPSDVPSFTPSAVPTVPPTFVPSITPTETPSASPFVTPSVVPSKAPSVVPTKTPTVNPSFIPSFAPSQMPTVAPSVTPTVEPSSVIYQVNMNSGYQVGMTSKHVFPVITVIPFGIVLVFFIVVCLFNNRAQESFYNGRVGLILGCSVMVVSCVQFAINLAGYLEVSEPRAGSWWIGIAAFFPSLLSNWFCTTYKAAGISTVFLLSALLIGIISTIGDGLYYSHVLRGIQACTNSDGHLYGDNDYFSAAEICLNEASAPDLACIHRNNKRCYYFFTTYTSLMEAGFAFDIVLLTVLFFLFCWQSFCFFSLDTFFYTNLHLDKKSPKPLDLVIADVKVNDDGFTSEKLRNDLESSYELTRVDDTEGKI